MSDDLVTCYNCATEIDSDSEFQVINEHNYCMNCVVTCEVCDTSVASHNSIGGYCSECGFYCHNCDTASDNNESYEVDGDSWCQRCYENYTYYCESCDNTYPDSYSSCYVQGATYCESCYSDNCYYCDDCGDDFQYENPCDCRSGSSDRCNNCGTRNPIHEYSCKPDIVFHGKSKNNLYMGFELETEIGSDINDASTYASQALSGVAILKHDSSIGRGGRSGFEIVTQPHTHAQYRDKSSVIWETIDKLRTDYHARSWDTDTCGLHIHVSRKGFSSGAHTHRFLAFVYKNAEMMMKFGGRKSSYARFNDVWRFDEYDRPIFSLKHKLDINAPTERYSAVNTQNRDTLELRFFRGTMNPDGVLSALDLTQAMVEYTRDLRISDVQMGALTWEWFADYVTANNGLYPSLYSRMDKVQSVNINKPITLGA